MRSLLNTSENFNFQLRTKVCDLKVNTSINCQVLVILGLRPVTIPKQTLFCKSTLYVSRYLKWRNGGITTTNDFESEDLILTIGNDLKFILLMLNLFFKEKNFLDHNFRINQKKKQQFISHINLIMKIKFLSTIRLHTFFGR
jgi:hypothetical protein